MSNFINTPITKAEVKELPAGFNPLSHGNRAMRRQHLQKSRFKKNSKAVHQVVQDGAIIDGNVGAGYRYLKKVQFIPTRDSNKKLTGQFRKIEHHILVKPKAKAMRKW